MERNPDLICMGEDIGLLGGAFGVTDGLQAKYGTDRVYDMPISEGAIVGVACGLCLNGKSAMVEMQFIDFISRVEKAVEMMLDYAAGRKGRERAP
jgi:2-oxoisovalerate dehydrogenase E1 component beta subunit